jgi:YihY family inner membrane protein
MTTPRDLDDSRDLDDAPRETSPVEGDAAHGEAAPPSDADASAPRRALGMVARAAFEYAADPGDDARPAEAEPAASVSTAALARLREVRARVVPQAPEYRPTRGRRTWLLCMYVLRRWAIEDRASGMAALLTMQTLLSTVPVIGVALLVVGLMDEAAGADLLSKLFGSLVPQTDRADEMADGALGMARNVTFSRLGGMGFLATLVLAFALFSTLERTFNRVWRVVRKRSVIVQFTMFYTLATLGPILMLFSLATPLLAGVNLVLASPLLVSIAGLTILNRFLPYTQVTWRAAFIGGVISAVLIELSKIGFGFYATRFALRTYESVYGPLAIFPILIVWSYVSWLVIILGAQITYAVQQHKAIALQGYLNRYVLERSEYLRPTGRTAAHLMLAIADHHAARKVGVTIAALGERFRLALDHVGEMVDALERAGLVVETTEPMQLIIPARPLDQIRVIDVLTLFDRNHAMALRDDHLGGLLRELDLARSSIMGGITFAELVEGSGGPTRRVGADDRGDRPARDGDPPAGARPRHEVGTRDAP